MSRAGIKTGPLRPGFCPSDSAETPNLVEIRQRLEEENAALKVRLAALEQSILGV